MDDFLYGLIIGAVCVAVLSFAHGFVSEWRKDVGRRDYEEFKRIQEEFDRQNSSWVGLTIDESSALYNKNYDLYATDMPIGDFIMIQREIEAKLKEKNA